MHSRLLGRLGVITLGVAAVGAFATPASANECPIAPSPGEPIYVNPCFDVGTSDPDPSNPGTNVYFAASASVGAYGSERFCTGYVVVGGQVDLDAPLLSTVQPDYFVESIPHSC